MKVADVLKKVNYANSEIPVYMQSGTNGESRKAESMDYADYYYEERARTVTMITLQKDRMVIHYK